MTDNGCISPHGKFTEMVLEANERADLAQHVNHLKLGDLTRNKTLMLTAFLSETITRP